MTISGNGLRDGYSLPRNAGQDLSVLCIKENNKPNPNVVLKLDGNCIRIVYQGQLCYSKPGMFDKRFDFL